MRLDQNSRNLRIPVNILVPNAPVTGALPEAIQRPDLVRTDFPGHHVLGGTVYSVVPG